MNNNPLYQDKLPFCTVSVYADYVYAIMDEGITVHAEYNDILLELVHNFIETDPFVYITHRKNSYAVDPTIYIETAKIKNLTGFIVIDEGKSKDDVLNFERSFFKKPFIKCSTLEEALIAKNKIIAMRI